MWGVISDVSLSPNFLEAVNGTQCIIFLALEFFFARYVLREMWWQARLESLRSYDDNWAEALWHGIVAGYRRRKAAVCMTLLLGGDVLIRGNAWAWRHYNFPAETVWLTYGVLVGAILCTAGGICALKHFAPTSWGLTPWLYIPVIGIVFSVMVAYLT